MKIDTKLIEGYDAMTPEQKLAALESYEMDMTGWIEKTKFDKVSSDVAAAKKALREKQTADEQAEADRVTKQQELEQKYNDLLRSTTIAQRKADYIAMGYDAKLAEDTATAIADGDMAKVLTNQQTFLAAHDKALKAEALKNMSGLQGGDHEPAVDENITLAQSIGKAKAATGDAVQNVMANYKI